MATATPTRDTAASATSAAYEHAYLLALNCGSSSLKLKLFSLRVDEVATGVGAGSSAAGQDVGHGYAYGHGHGRRPRMRSLSSSGSAHSMGGALAGQAASTDLPHGLELLIAASISIKTEGDGRRAATLKWGRIPAGSQVDRDDKVQMQHADIATEAFLNDVLDQLSRALVTSSSRSGSGNDSPDLRSHLRFITHRVVHGATLPQPYIIKHDEPGENGSSAAHLAALERLEVLAPLHNVVSTRVIKLCLKLLPRVVHLCLWDTAFHWSMPEEVRTYPIWQPHAIELPGGMELRRYGFHGLSYSSVLRQVSAFLERPAASLNLIVAHLGSGASLCAIRAGKSYDTTMGLTPLEGLPGSTRSGSVDPALPYHLKPDPARHGNGPSSTSNSDDKLDLSEQGRVTVPGGEGIQLNWAEWELNSKSGWFAVAGTRDFQDIVARMNGHAACTEDERHRAKLAFDIFVDRIISYLGAFYFKLCAAGATHIDALVFSGGIGEHSTELRMALANKLEHTPLALRSADGGYYGSDKVGGVSRIFGPCRAGFGSGSEVDERPRGRASSPAITSSLDENTPGFKSTFPASSSPIPALGSHSPLGPGPGPSASLPGSPRASHASLSYHHHHGGRCSVPWLICQTDEELECVRLAMPSIRQACLEGDATI